jgi:hypothetical protein
MKAEMRQRAVAEMTRSLDEDANRWNATNNAIINRPIDPMPEIIETPAYQPPTSMIESAPVFQPQPSFLGRPPENGPLF